jgi:hypothetical protein
MADDADQPSAAPVSTQPEDKTDAPGGVDVAPGERLSVQGQTIAEKTDETPVAEAPRSERTAGEGGLPTAKKAARVRWKPSRRSVGLGLALFGMCALLTVEVVFMARSRSQRDAATQASVQPTSVVVPSPSVALAPTSATVVQEEADASAPVFDDESVEGEPSSKRPEVPRHYATVQEAASRSCSTASVDGLSRQIISEARCINPNALVPLPARPNLVLDSHVFPYLEIQARDHLVKALDAHRDGTMIVHSALRTVAQQYLVWRWSANKRCGVPLATPPGDSNHENGLALDIAEQARWRPALEAQGFHWLGASDRVHFDYKGASASAHRSEDVRAFQRLWNRNHPDDSIANDGHYNPTTEQRLRKAPPDGFRLGPACAKSKPARSGN